MRAPLGLLLAVLSLGGCETAPPEIPPVTVQDPAAAWDARQARLHALDAWTAVGRIAVRSPEESWTATVRWVQDGSHYSLRLSGPLGQGALEVSGEPGRVQLRTADRQVFVASDPEELLRERTGWRVPIAGLRHWILGAAEPSEPAEDLILDPGGRLKALTQSGWRLAYERYGGPPELPLPTKLTMNNDRVVAKLVVARWRIGL